MPANIITAADLLRDLTQQALGEDRKQAYNIPQSLALRWFTDAYREIVRRVQFMTDTWTANITQNIPQVPGPTDILDRLITHDDALRIKSSTGHWMILTLRDWQYVRDMYPDLTFANSRGCPVDWTWDETSPGNLLILPPSPASVVNGLSLDYVQDPGTLTRLYDDDMATCAVVNNSSFITFAASVSGLAQVGDSFGVKDAAGDLPTDWYVIWYLSPDGMTAEISSPYAGSTNSAALFTLTQASLCERKRPNLCMYAPVQYALWKYWTREDQTKAVNYQIAFWGGQIPAPKSSGQRGQWMTVDGEMQRIAKAAGDRPGLTQRGVDTVRRYAGVRSRWPMGAGDCRRFR